jgi:hypothetical protein
MAKSHSAEFYVYAAVEADGSFAYVGKGSGNRYKAQQRRFKLPVHILSWHEIEQNAFDEEVRLIAKHNPVFNKHPGGQGGRSRNAYLADITRIGTREYARRLLLRFGRPFLDKKTLNLLQNAGELQ